MGTPQYAKDIWPDTCSCGVNYNAQGITYKEHLKEKHIIKTG